MARQAIGFTKSQQELSAERHAADLWQFRQSTFSECRRIAATNQHGQQYKSLAMASKQNGFFPKAPGKTIRLELEGPGHDRVWLEVPTSLWNGFMTGSGT